MTPSSLPSPPSKPTPSWKATFTAVIEDVSDDPDHPLQIALRTYSLCLSLLLGPVLLPTIFALAVHPEKFTARASVFWRALSRELRPTGFASAITAAVGGGAALQRLWNFLEHRHTHHRGAWVHYINSKLSLCQKAFLANIISSTLGVVLLRWTRYRRLGATLDLSLLLLVRALDASVQAFLLQKARRIAGRRVRVPSHNDVESRLSKVPSDTRLLDKQSEDLAKEWKNKVATHLDALVFWASSARFVTVHPTVSTVFGSFILPLKDHVVLLLSTSEVYSFYFGSWLV
jgi:ABC-type multidrug transport system fused ATPase/permease subunit